MDQPPANEKKIPYERIWVGQSKIKAIIALTHPTAVILFSLITWILACLTLSRIPDLSVSLRLIFSMAAAQSSVGVFNEVFDWRLDKETKPWRAIPAGLIHPRWAAVLGFVLLCLSLLISAQLSPFTMLLLLAGAGMGILYSAKLKRTRYSWLPYVTNYPSIPVWTAVALERFDPRILVIYALASPFAIVTHLCNQLRDFDEDQAIGVRGLVQHLGKQRAIHLFFMLEIFIPLPFLILMGLHAQPVIFLIVLMPCILHWLLIMPLAQRRLDSLSPDSFRSLFRRLQITGPLMLIAWYWVFLHS